jgi:pimeloyl-ACP methyl ester carboxylesterase
MYFKTADVEGLRVFYREAGDPSKPTIVLLHGFPSSLAGNATSGMASDNTINGA